MSTRFHNKLHRRNHSSFKDENQPDSGWDPIASTESPFRGEFVLSGYLSAFNPLGEYSILTNNILASDTIRSTNMFVTSSLTAENMVVHYIDVRFTETSGFAIRGEDFRLSVPLTCPINDVLLLSGIGLSATSWVSFGGDLQVSRNLSVSGNTNIYGNLGVVTLSTNSIYPYTPNTFITIPSASFDRVETDYLSATKMIGNDLTVATATFSTIAVDTINTNTASQISLNNHVRLTNGYALSGYEAHFTNIYGTNYFGITSNNLQITVSQGWNPIQLASISQYTPEFTSWKYSIDNNLAHPAIVTDTMIVVNISATDYRSYGELEGTVNGLKVAGARIGNIGLLPNSNVEHASKSGLWIDNESTFTFVAPSGQSWSVNTLSGYYDAINTDANLQVKITVYDQSLITTNFIGDNLTIPSVMVTNLSADHLTFTNSNVVTSDGTFTSTGSFLTLNIAGSTLYMPLYR